MKNLLNLNCFKNKLHRFVILLILLIISLISSFSSVNFYLRFKAKEKFLNEKRSNWKKRWASIRPLISSIPFDPILSLIRNIIVVAVERHLDVE